MEFCNPKTFQIILAIDKERYDIYTLEELLPQGFGPSNLVQMRQKEQKDEVDGNEEI